MELGDTMFWRKPMRRTARDFDFRAWDSGKKRMLYQDHGDVCRCGPNEWEWSPCCIVFDDYPEEPDWKQLKLMQFTGRRDNKRTEEYPEGQKVYEGDIVRGTGFIMIGFSVENLLGQVVWEEDIWRIGFGIEPIAGLHSMDINGEIEVVGNIYENPELLEAE
jgi:uncharacterized phage protein (TIGR01671 family)